MTKRSHPVSGRLHLCFDEKIFGFGKSSLAPTITAISGDGQQGDTSTFLSQPLVVQVTGTNGPISGAPVEFLMQGGGGFASSTSQATASWLNVSTDSNSFAQVYFQLPNTPGQSLTIQAVPASGDFGAIATFTVSCFGVPASPVLLSGSLVDSGFQITWSESASHAADFAIERSEDGGQNWSQIGTATADATTDIDSTVSPNIFYIYRVSAENQYGRSAPSNDISVEGTDPQTADSDGDGMPDAWELRNGLNPLDPTDALADSDGDGYPNIYETLGSQIQHILIQPRQRI